MAGNITRLIRHFQLIRNTPAGSKPSSSSSALFWTSETTSVLQRSSVNRRESSESKSQNDLQVRQQRLLTEDGFDGRRSRKYNWKAVSLAGIILAAIAKSGIDSDLLPSRFILHAAKPFLSEDDDDQHRIINRRGSMAYGENKNETGKISKRQQFNFLVGVVEKAVNAVVRIQIKDHSMVDWYRGTPRTVSNGSGFIIREDGLIVTNAHVVNQRGRSAIAVHLADGRVYAGHVEAMEPENDLALIRIKEKGLPTLKLANSDEIRLGEWVVGIGSPLSLSNSVSTGIVSSIKRGASELGVRGNATYIQTDAAVTFGNSGGPLVNLDGEAIGVNTMTVSSGISFAIPSDYVKQFLVRHEERKNKTQSGKAAPFRRYIGVQFLTITPDIMDQGFDFYLPSKGVLVVSVVVGSPAYVAGIQPGDVIMKVNDCDATTTKIIYDCLEKAHSLRFLIIRKGKQYQCEVHPEDIPLLF